MVTVTRENFDALLPEITDVLARASFVSFDEEMSGIEVPAHRSSRADIPEQRYEKMTHAATKFSVIQVGLCAFVQASDADAKDRFVGHAYTFFLFPEYGPDITLSASACSFLRKNGMDFGAWMGKGVPFVDREQAEKLRKRHSESAEKIERPAPRSETEVATIMPNREQEIAFLEEQKSLFRAWVDGPEPRFVFASTNAYLRKCIYQFVEANFPELKTERDESGGVCVIKMTADERRAVLADLQSKLDSSLGFRLVFEQLVALKKPVVGHNCLFDLMFLYRWLEHDLPPSLTEFKVALDALFPLIYDTKYISTSGVLGAALDDTVLGDLYSKVVLQTAEQGLAEGFAVSSSSDLGTQLHEAGYDAYMTGACFARFLVQLGGWQAMSALALRRLYLMQSLFNLSLAPAEPNGTIRYPGTVLHLSDFPVETKTSDITALFGEPSNSEILWIDKTSTFVVVKELGAVALPPGAKLDTYEEYRSKSASQVSEGFTVDGIWRAISATASSLFGVSSGPASPSGTTPTPKRKREA